MEFNQVARTDVWGVYLTLIGGDGVTELHEMFDLFIACKMAREMAKIHTILMRTVSSHCCTVKFLKPWILRRWQGVCVCMSVHVCTYVFTARRGFQNT